MPGAAAEPPVADSIPHTSLPCHTLGCTNPCEQLSTVPIPLYLPQLQQLCKIFPHCFKPSSNPPLLLGSGFTGGITENWAVPDAVGEVGHLHHPCEAQPFEPPLEPALVPQLQPLCQGPSQHLENTEESSQKINLELQTSCPLLHTDLLDLSTY